MEQPVSCQTCGTEVLVEKFSWQHTNVQWTAPSAEVCPRVQEEVRQGVAPSRALTCPDLHDSVHQAALDGQVTISE